MTAAIRSLVCMLFMATVGWPMAMGIAMGGQVTTCVWLTGEEGNRDKTGTDPCPENSNGSQMVMSEPLTSRVSCQAEGRGLEPPIPCGTPDFESGR